jgi:hypothetical protein
MRKKYENIEEWNSAYLAINQSGLWPKKLDSGYNLVARKASMKRVNNYSKDGIISIFA